MSNPGQITVKISAIADEFNKVMGGVSSKMTGLGKDFDVVSLRLQTLSGNLSAAGSKMSLMLTLPIIGLGAAAVKSAASFETLETSMKTIFSSSEAAKNAMAWIEDFSATTPYQMDEVADAFKKLSAYGFDATRVIGTLGDTASAMGKSLDQAVEMFADATTGEFERLKEFGVKARTEGDKVTFSYTENGQALTKTVNKTSTDIAAGLNSIFAKYKGGMEEQSKTLNGSLSNMIDSLSRLGRIIGDSLAPFIKSMAETIGSAAQALSGMDEGTRAWVVGIGVALAAAGPLLLVIGKLVAGYRAFILIQAGVTAAMQGHAVATGAAAAGSAAYTIAMKAATLATRLFTAAWALTPLGVIVAGVVALGAALYAIGRAMKNHADRTGNMSEKAAEAAKRNKELADAIKGVGESSEEAKKDVDGYIDSLAGLSTQAKIKKINDSIQDLENRTRMLSSHDEQRVKNLGRINELVKQRSSLEKEALQSSRQAQKQASEDLLRERKAASDKWTKYNEEAGLNEVQKAELWYNREYQALADANARKLISDEMYAEAAENLEKELAQKKEKIRKEEENKKIRDAFAGISTIQGQIRELGNLFSMFYSNKSAEVDNWQTKQLAAIATSYDAEKANIESTITDKTQRDAALKALDEKRARDEKSIQEKAEKDKRKLQREAAKKEKQIATFETLLGIPKAAFDAYQSVVKIPFVGPALAFIAATAATAFGFAKLALIQAQPLPALAEGGYFAGPAVIGEAGREFAFPIDGPQGQTAMSLLADRLLDSLSAKLSKTTPIVDRSATVEKPSMLGQMTVIIQDAGRTLGEYIGEVVEDGSRRGNFVVYARGKA